MHGNMKKIKKKSLEWKPVQLNGAILSSGIEGLVGIEELTSYQIENDEVKPFHNTKQIKASLNQIKVKKKKCLTSREPNLKYKKPKLKNQIKVQPSTLSNSEFTSNTIVQPSDLTVVQNDPPEDDKTFDTLPWTLLHVPLPVAKALVELGFREPTEIQRLSIPPAIQGRRDILGAAETGSGKTLAFGIPIIQGILNNIEVNYKQESENEDSASESDLENEEIDDIGCVRVVNLGKNQSNAVPVQKLWALILTPTRELAVQIKDHLVAALKYTNIKVVVVVGGMSMEKQQRLLKRQPHIVVATPGRLWELVNQGEPHFNNIEDISYLAIDETDRMTEVNHFPELRSLLERINIDPVKKKLRQNFVFSATLTLVHDLPIHTKLKNKSKKKKKNLILSSDDKLKNLINLLGITNPKIIDVTKKTGMADLLTETSIVCSIDQKDYYLFYFLQQHPGRTLVFCNSISCVRRLASLLSILDVQPLPLHANMIQKQRLKNLERFRDSPHGLLLATDVAARGLDIPLVDHVIHYQVPRTSETYVHRSGRTARANHEGLTLLLIETGEQRQYLRLMKTLNRDKELPRFPIVNSLMEAVKLKVNLARDIDKMQLEYKKASSKVNWMEKTAQEMDLILDEDEMPERVNDRATAVIKRQISIKQKQLKSLLKQTPTPQGFSYKYPSLNESVSTAAGAFRSSQSAIEVVKSVSNYPDRKRKRSVKPFRVKKKKKFQTSIKNEL